MKNYYCWAWMIVDKGEVVNDFSFVRDDHPLNGWDESNSHLMSVEGYRREELGLTEDAVEVAVWVVQTSDGVWYTTGDIEEYQRIAREDV